MHFTGTIWRPPYEAESLLLQATAGCTHHGCRFCTLYDDLPFDFRVSPAAEVEADLQELQLLYTDPVARRSAQLQGFEMPYPERVFLVGANPFVLSFRRLRDLSSRIHRYFPTVRSIGCFARITDVAGKSSSELSDLHALGYDDITLGVETGDDKALTFMRKGYVASDIALQSARLDDAEITYRYFYLTGISGRGHGMDGAKKSAAIFNQTHPRMIGSSMLTFFPSSALFGDLQSGRWQEESELEKLLEMKTLIESLEISTEFAALGASNLFQLQGRLPDDHSSLIRTLDRIIQTFSEEDLRSYRSSLQHL